MTLHVANATILDMLGTVGFTGSIGASPKLRIYSGTKPTDADAALGAATQLAEMVCPATPILSITDTNPGGRVTFDTIPPDASADASGTPAFWRLYKNDGTTVRLQGEVGAGKELVLNTSTISAGGSVAVTAFTFNLPEGP